MHPMPPTDALPRALYRAEQVRALDRCAIDQHGMSGIELMERAGAAALSWLRERWPRATRLCVLAGLGNNGGDGYVVARLASEQGLDVRVLTLGDHDRLKGEAATAAKAFVEGGGQAQPLVTAPGTASVRRSATPRSSWRHRHQQSRAIASRGTAHGRSLRVTRESQPPRGAIVNRSLRRDRVRTCAFTTQHGERNRARGNLLEKRGSVWSEKKGRNSSALNLAGLSAD